MFTGIVEHVGTVVAVTQRGKVVQLTIDCGPIVEGVHLGDSIAINGTDLTVTTMAGTSLRFEMVQETGRHHQSRSASPWQPGQPRACLAC